MVTAVDDPTAIKVALDSKKNKSWHQPTATKGPRKHTNCYEGTKETHQLPRRDQGNTPTATKGPRKHTNCYDGTKETYPLLRRDQGNTPTAKKGPRKHTNC